MGVNEYEDRTPAVAGKVAGVPSLPPGANRPGWLDLLSVIAIMWYAIIVVIVGLSVIWIGLGDPDGNFEGFLEGPEALFPDVLLAVVTLTACWEFACRRHGRSFASGLDVVPVAPRVMALSVLAGIGCTTLGVLLAQLVSSGPSSLQDYLLPAAENGSVGHTLFLPILLLSVPLSLCNELFYRGFLYPTFSRLIGPFPAIIPTVGLQVLPLMLVMFDERNFVDPITAGIIGAVFSWIRHRYQSVVPCLIARFAGDVTQFGWIVATAYGAVG